MGRLKNVIDETLTKEKSLILDVPEGAKEIQFVFDRTRFELPSPDDESEGELFRCELCFGPTYIYLGSGLAIDRFFGGGCDDTRIEGHRTPRPGQRMLWTFFSWPIPPNIEEIPVRIRPARPFYCLMHVDFFHEGTDPELLAKQLEAVDNL